VKVGDLVQVTEPRIMGGRCMGAMGLVLEKYRLQRHPNDPVSFRWLIWWVSDTAITHGHGMEVINESG